MAYFLTARGADGVRDEAELYRLLSDAIAGQSHRAVRLMHYERSLGISLDNPLKFSKAWALEEHLGSVAPGHLLVHFDADFSLRPDSVHGGFVDLMLQRKALGGEPGHIFLADTWNGIDCVNSGFIGLRNTDVARLFLELWQHKSHWPASQDQTALAETVLEMVGAEAQKLSSGRKRYDHQCLTWFFPDSEGEYNWANYCHCWQNLMRDFVGPYRLRRSRVVSFVDPERVEMNFVPMNLFSKHFLDRAQTWFLPTRAWPMLDPLAVHWAGFHDKAQSMKHYFRRRFNLSLGSAGCPKWPPPLAHQGFGTMARAVRCCDQLWRPLAADASAMEQLRLDWGCLDWRPISEETCLELFPGGRRGGARRF